MMFKKGDRVRVLSKYSTDSPYKERIGNVFTVEESDDHKVWIEAEGWTDYFHREVELVPRIEDSSGTENPTVVEEPTNELASPQVYKEETFIVDTKGNEYIKLTRAEAEQLHRKLGELLK